MIDHLPPFLQIPPADGFLPELKQRIAACQSDDPAVRGEREAALRAFAREHGLAERLALDAPDWPRRMPFAVREARRKKPSSDR